MSQDQKSSPSKEKDDEGFCGLPADVRYVVPGPPGTPDALLTTAEMNVMFDKAQEMAKKQFEDVCERTKATLGPEEYHRTKTEDHEKRKNMGLLELMARERRFFGLLQGEPDISDPVPLTLEDFEAQFRFAGIHLPVHKDEEEEYDDMPPLIQDDDDDDEEEDMPPLTQGDDDDEDEEDVPPLVERPVAYSISLRCD